MNQSFDTDASTRREELTSYSPPDSNLFTSPNPATVPNTLQSGFGNAAVSNLAVSTPAVSVSGALAPVPDTQATLGNVASARIAEIQPYASPLLPIPQAESAPTETESVVESAPATSPVTGVETAAPSDNAAAADAGAAPERRVEAPQTAAPAARSAAPTSESAAPPSTSRPAAGRVPGVETTPNVGGEETATEGPVASSPQSDPAFQAVVGRSQAYADRTRAHIPANAAAAQGQAAAVSPPNEVSSRAAAGQVGVMDQQQPGRFDREAFKAALREKINQNATPQNMEEAENFRESGSVDNVRQDLSNTARGETNQAQTAIETTTAQPPDTGGIEARQSTPLPAAGAGPQPPNIGAAQAVPPPRPESEVSRPQDAAQLDQQMTEAGVTEQQLQNSNEPAFTSALGATNSAREHDAQAPQAFRQEEESVRGQASGEAVEAAQAQLQGMHGSRAQALGRVTGLQGSTSRQDQQQRTEIANHIEAIYDRTKQAVEARLARLDEDVNRKFDDGANLAQQQFENFVEREVKEFKVREYGFEILGDIAEFLHVLPDEVNEIFTRARTEFIRAMDQVIDDVAGLVETGLNDAKDLIAAGKREIQDYVNQLPAALRRIGRESARNIQGRFDELDQTVNDKQTQLVETLAQKYSERLQQIDERVQQLQAEHQNLWDMAKAAIGGVIETILNLKNMLLNVLARAAEAVELIISDPIGFLGNLVAGVKLGLENFVSKIGHYLQQALMDWLFGALGEAGIQMPETFDLKGILSLVMQVLGLTYANIRARAVNILGERIVSALEQAAEIFRILITQGPGGLWDYIKEKIGDLKSMVIDQIKSFVIERIVIAGITWIVGLLNPASAFVKACKAIYDIIMFFVERGSQILALVNAVIDSMTAIARGNIAVAANFVENALARALPVVISFLAALLGLGGISEKIKSIIEAIRRPINAAIDWVIRKAVDLVKAAGRLLGFGREEEAPATADPEHDLKVQAGLAAIDEEEKNHSQTEKITHTQAKTIASKVKAAFPIFTSLIVIDGGETWDYEYKASPKGKKKGPKKPWPPFSVRIDFNNMTESRSTATRLPKNLRKVTKEGVLTDQNLQGRTVTFLAEVMAIGSSSKRRGAESQLPSPSKVDLGLEALDDNRFERAHGIGAGFGVEFAIVLYAPRDVNQRLQNRGIEKLIREIAKDRVAAGQDVKISVELSTHAGTMRLKSILYRVEVTGGEHEGAFEVGINVAKDLKNPRLSSEGKAEFYGDIGPIIMPIVESVLKESGDAE